MPVQSDEKKLVDLQGWLTSPLPHAGRPSEECTGAMRKFSCAVSPNAVVSHGEAGEQNHACPVFRFTFPFYFFLSPCPFHRIPRTRSGDCCGVQSPRRHLLRERGGVWLAHFAAPGGRTFFGPARGRGLHRAPSLRNVDAADVCQREACGDRPGGRGDRGLCVVALPGASPLIFYLMNKTYPAALAVLCAFALIPFRACG